MSALGGTGSDCVDILSLGLLCSSSRITWLNALPPLCQVAKILYCFVPGCQDPVLLCARLPRSSTALCQVAKILYCFVPGCQDPVLLCARLPRSCTALCQVAKILYCFATTFRRVPRKERVTSQGSLVEASDVEQEFTFTVGLEFKEDDGKGNYSTCPKDKNVFKLKVNTEKRLAITVQHTGPQSLRIER